MPIVLPEPVNPPGWVEWPNNLPKCATSWSEQSEDPRIRTEMDVGQPKTRRRYTGIMRKVNVTMEISLIADTAGGAVNQLVLLRDFFESPGDPVNHNGSTDAGYHFFKFTSPVDGLDHYYRFVSAPAFSNNGPVAFTATMEWEEM